jgi:hypothetical protein
MSESELSDAPSHAIPSDATLETELRRVVRDALKQDEDITVRLARARVEEQLGLEADFFTKDEWKKRSKDIITAAVDEPESPVKAKPKAGRKRKSDEPAKKPTKRAKKSAVVESDDDDDEMKESMTEEEDEEEEEEKPKRKPRAQAKAKPPPKAKAKPKPKAKAKPSSPVVESDEDEDEDEENHAPKAEPETKAATIDSEAEDEQPQTIETSETIKPDEDKATSPVKPSEPADEDNDSDMSVLIDDPPPKKKGGRAKKSTSPGTTAQTTKKATATTASSKDVSPDEEEIKRLQSWLVKCGIRKLWHRELANDKFPTSKAKIAHLKSMLTDAGMTGRFSAEKAKSIKEARELEAELEAARDFEEQFGTGGRSRRAKKNAGMKDQGSDDDDDGDEGEKEDGDKAEGAKRPGGRLLPKGLVDFGDSGDDGSD